MPAAALATTGSVLTATEYNYLPRGLLAYSSAVTAQFTTSSTHTTFQDVTNYSVSTTYSANRILRVTIQVGPFIPGGANNVVYKIVRGSTDVQSFDVPNEAMATGFAHSFVFSATFAGPASGSTETFKLQMRGTANTQVGNNASASNVGRIIVEDLGAQ